jgi:regulator of replication initiation timing
MIQTESPYLVDKQLVLQNINEMKDVLQKNTEVIAQLNLEIARLRTELDRLDQ